MIKNVDKVYDILSNVETGGEGLGNDQKRELFSALGNPSPKEIDKVFKIFAKDSEKQKNSSVFRHLIELKSYASEQNQQAQQNKSFADVKKAAQEKVQQKWQDLKNKFEPKTKQEGDISRSTKVRQAIDQARMVVSVNVKTAAYAAKNLPGNIKTVVQQKSRRNKIILDPIAPRKR